MSKRRYRWMPAILGLVILLAPAGATTALAQQGRPGVSREQRERMIRTRIRQVFLRDLRTYVDLNDEQMRELVPMLEDLEARRLDYQKRRGGLRTQIKGLIEDLASSDDEIARKLVDLRTVESEFGAAEQAVGEEIRTLLSPRQQAQLLVFHEEFRRRIEGRMHDLRREVEQREALRRNRFRQGDTRGSGDERP